MGQAERRSTLKIGIDVPWVTSWTAEPDQGVRACPTVDGMLAIAQAFRPGFGRPQYSRNHLFRQRDSVRALLCPMCGKPTHDGDRWSQTGRWTTAGALRARGVGGSLPSGMADDKPLLDAGAIAPLHRTCAEASLKQCPHLSKLEDTELKAFPSAWIVSPLMVEARAPANGPANLQPSVAVVSFLQLIGVPDHG